MMVSVKVWLTVVCIGLVSHGSTVWAQAWEGRVTRVLDGDSLRIRHGAQVETIRLYGIDCPEYGQPGWQEAKDMTSALVQGQELIVAPMDTDRYGRTVALVQLRGRMLNTELVQTGMAWVYPQYCRMPSLCGEWTNLEQRARQLRLGLWREDRPVSPWVWKRRQR